jgi:hypothetical protein
VETNQRIILSVPLTTISIVEIVLVLYHRSNYGLSNYQKIISISLRWKNHQVFSTLQLLCHQLNDQAPWYTMEHRSIDHIKRQQQELQQPLEPELLLEVVLFFSSSPTAVLFVPLHAFVCQPEASASVP